MSVSACTRSMSGILVVLFLFFTYRFFDVPERIFVKMSHHAVCSEISHVLCGCSYMLPEKLTGEKLQLRQFADPKSTL